VYCEPVRPLIPEKAPSSGIDTALFIRDVTGKRVITTGFGRTVTVHAENSAAALEVISRFAADPRWLIHLPPTMSPVETSQAEGYLERPEQAFSYYASEGVTKIVCEEKHMGSRAIMVVCRSPDVAAGRFGIANGERGKIYTRTGRPFFRNLEDEKSVLTRTIEAAESSGLLDELQSDWLCLDAEIMPWSVKAQELIERQYGPVGAAADAALSAADDLVQKALARGVDLKTFAGSITSRKNAADKYRDAYRPYVWPVTQLDDMRIAPFHILASEGVSHADKSNLWHMEHCHKIAAADDALFFATQYRVVSLDDVAECEGVAQWWEDLTSQGGEGMVVKPFNFVARGKRGLIQPAVKVRGKEYLRIIYGPDYDIPENLDRLRHRGLGRKRSLALREFALGLAALQRFVDHEPLRSVHECAVAVLAMESEPVDPRL
jgi:protein phosphatase